MKNASIAGYTQAGLVSLEQYTSAHFAIYQVIIPIISLIGIVGNGMSLFILANDNVKYAFATYLKALTITDICVLIVALVRFAVDMSGYFISKETFNTLKAYEQIWNANVIRTIFQQLTASFVTIISVERFVAVLFPLKVKSFVFDRYPRRVVSVTIVIYLILAIPMLFFSEVSTIVDTVTNTTTKIVSVSEFGNTTLPFFIIFISIVKVIIPLIIVVSTTLAIVVILKRRMIPPGDHLRTTASKWCIERNKTTQVLIVIATFFTCNAMITLSITTMMVFYKAAVTRQPLLVLLCTEIRLLLICLNSANDFIIYILSSKKFRKIFIAKFCSYGIKHDNISPATKSEQDPQGSGMSATSRISYSDVSYVYGR